MNNIELIGKSNLVSQIPWSFEGKKLSSEVASNIVLLKVEYDKALNNFRNSMTSILQSLKSEEFLKKEQLINDMLLIEKKNKEQITSDECKILEEARNIKEDYLKEKEQIELIYNEAYKKKLYEEVTLSRGLNVSDWKEIYDMLSNTDSIAFRFPNGETKDIEVSLFLKFIGELIIE